MVNTFTHYPYQGEAVRSIAVYFQGVVAAIAGYGTLTGCAVTRTSATEVAIAAGTYADGTPPNSNTYVGGSVTAIPAASASNHRYDVIYIDSSDGTAKRVAGVQGVPTNASNFLENTVPQPPDLPDENAVILAVIGVDETGIFAGDHGSYSVAGCADMRFKVSVGDHDISYLYDSGEAQGDLIVRKAAAWGNLAAGLSGKYLKSQGAAADLVWDYLLVSSLYDASQTRGDLITRGVAAWERKAPGSANYYLMSNGAGADLTWEKIKIGSLYHASEAQGNVITRGATSWSVLPPGTAGYVLKSGGAAADVAWASASTLLDTIGSTEGDFLKRGASTWGAAPLTTYRFWDAPPTAWSVPGSSGADLTTDTGTNGWIDVLDFDPSSDEYVQATLKVPSDIYTSGTVTIEVAGYGKTGASGNVVWIFQHSPRALGGNESWDAAYSSVSSGAKAVDADQDQLSHHSWTASVSTLGWAANDQVRIRFYRDADNASDTYAYDFRVTHVRVKIPTVIS